jgi:hypothetical protein
VHNITLNASNVAPTTVSNSIATLTGHENNVCVLGISTTTTVDTATTAACIVTGTTGFIHEGRITGAQLRWWKQSNNTSIDTTSTSLQSTTTTQRYSANTF